MTKLPMASSPIMGVGEKTSDFMPTSRFDVLMQHGSTIPAPCHKRIETRRKRRAAYKATKAYLMTTVALFVPLPRELGLAHWAMGGHPPTQPPAAGFFVYRTWIVYA